MNVAKFKETIFTPEEIEKMKHVQKVINTYIRKG